MQEGFDSWLSLLARRIGIRRAHRDQGCSLVRCSAALRPSETARKQRRGERRASLKKYRLHCCASRNFQPSARSPASASPSLFLPYAHSQFPQAKFSLLLQLHRRHVNDADRDGGGHAGIGDDVQRISFVTRRVAAACTTSNARLADLCGGFCARGGTPGALDEGFELCPVLEDRHPA